ncbi:MAG: Uma2 family endonuclease [Isosphaeraceae bacterium]
MTLEAFGHAEFQEGWRYELARGVVEVTEIPGLWHGQIVMRIARLFFVYAERHPGIIAYQAGAGECRLRLPGMVCDRHPDQAIYLDPPPPGPNVWARWIPHIVVEVVSTRGRKRDFVTKREEYLRMGIHEYWILDPRKRQMHALVRHGDTWVEAIVPAAGTYRTIFLPGLRVRPVELFGPAGHP